MANRIEGRVARILNERELALNIGKNHGVSEGMKFAILSAQPIEIVDPVSKKELGKVDRTKVRVKVTEIREEFSIARTYETYVTNVGGTAIGLDVLRTTVLTPPKYVTRVENLRADKADLPGPLQESESLVKINDRAVQILDEDQEYLIGTSQPFPPGHPTFDIQLLGTQREASRFRPEFQLRQTAGDTVASLQWRFRGQKTTTDWSTLLGAHFDRTRLTNIFDLTSPNVIRDEHLEGFQIGIELRFHWSSWRRELHRWPLNPSEKTSKPFWEIGPEILPPLYFEESPEMPDLSATTQ